MAQLIIGFSTVGDTKVKLYDVDLIKADILMHFNTRQGTRLNQPEYGTIIWDLLFEELTEQTKAVIVDDCKRILQNDSRVRLDHITVESVSYGLNILCQCYFIPFQTYDNLLVTFDKNLYN